jgi:hypothetical protein
MHAAEAKVSAYLVLCLNRNNGGVTLHGFLQDGQHDMSSRTDQQSHINAPSLMNPSSNNLALQAHHEQDHGHQQLLSGLGSEMLLSPTSPYGIQSSLIRSLMGPTAPAGFQQHDQYGQQMDQAPAAARFAPPLQFTNDAAFWNPSAGFGVPAAAPEQASVRAAKASPAPRAATLALKVCTSTIYYPNISRPQHWLHVINVC